MPKRKVSRAYNRYLNSSRWQRKRAAKLASVGHRCEKCPSRKRLEVHHLSYAHFGDEPLEDLQVLCHSCHRRAHKKPVRYARWRPVKVIRVDPKVLREEGTEAAIAAAKAA